VPVRLEIVPEPAYIAPALKVIIRIIALLNRDYLGKLPTQQRKRPFGPYYAHRHIVLVQHKNITSQTGIKFSKNHNFPPSNSFFKQIQIYNIFIDKSTVICYTVGMIREHPTFFLMFS